jgi:hypothetical protein
MAIAARFTPIEAEEAEPMKRSMTAIALMAALASAAGAAMAQEGPMRGDRGPMGGPMPGGIDFVAIDTDGDGSLGRAELQARAVARLAVIDTNQDGALDRDELIAAISDGRGRLVRLFTVDPAEERADRLLARMGGTEAGRVEVAVLASDRVNRLLAFADTDHDAAISQAEADAMQARVASWRDRHHGHDRHRGGRGDDHGDRHGYRHGGWQGDWHGDWQGRAKAPPPPAAPDGPSGGPSDSSSDGQPG